MTVRLNPRQHHRPTYINNKSPTSLPLNTNHNNHPISHQNISDPLPTPNLRTPHESIRHAGTLNRPTDTSGSLNLDPGQG